MIPPLDWHHVPPRKRTPGIADEWTARAGFKGSIRVYRLRRGRTWTVRHEGFAGLYFKHELPSAQLAKEHAEERVWRMR